MELYEDMALSSFFNGSGIFTKTLNGDTATIIGGITQLTDNTALKNLSSQGLGLSASLQNACYNWGHYNWHTCPTSSNKFEQAFKIVNKLLEKKLIKLTTIGTFVKTINEVAEIL